MTRKVIVTHHAPDLDAIGSSWLLKKFDVQHHADAKFTFVNPGEQLSAAAAAELEVTDLSNITHVDTGLGKFDHHQADRGKQFISATSLVYDYLCQLHPDLTTDRPLKLLVDIITEIDHFGEIHWPDPANHRYSFMLQQIILGLEFIEYHDDDSQLHFGFTCLEGVYSALKQQIKAEAILEESAYHFKIKVGQAVAVETRNDETIKLAQKQGFQLVIRKDPERGHIRIKARPDSDIELKPLYNKIKTLDTKGTWFYHQSGKMLINGTKKHLSQIPSPLSLDQIVQLVKELYA